MQTRQTPRKTISLPGRYFTGRGSPANVMLKDMSVGGCRFEANSPLLVPGTALQIFIAGTGPHHAHVKWKDKDEVGVTFVRQLTVAEFGSFQSCHVPVYLNPSSASAGEGEFDAMPDKPQRRFI